MKNKIRLLLAILAIILLAIGIRNHHYENLNYIDDYESYFYVNSDNNIYIRGPGTCGYEGLNTNIVKNNYLITIVEVIDFPPEAKQVYCPAVPIWGESTVKVEKKSLFTFVTTNYRGEEEYFPHIKASIQAGEK